MLNRKKKIIVGICSLILVVLTVFLAINQSSLELSHQAGFQNYNSGKVYFLGCKLKPSKLISAEIKAVELKRFSDKNSDNAKDIFEWETYWDNTAKIGATSIDVEEFNNQNYIPLDSKPIKDLDGSYALLIAVKPMINFESKALNDYYFEIHYTVLGFPKTVMFKPFNQINF